MEQLVGVYVTSKSGRRIVMDKKNPTIISDNRTLPQKHLIRKPHPNTKSFTLLRHFASGLSLHRFQAERLGDHVLPSSISDLSKRFGIEFIRRSISVPNNYGGRSSVMEYWLEGECLDKAKSITKA